MQQQHAGSHGAVLATRFVVQRAKTENLVVVLFSLDFFR